MFALVLSVILGCGHRGPVLPSTPTVREVQVGWGDTLWSIATRYGVEGGYPALARLNGIRNPDHIEYGQRLRVPTLDDSLPPWPTATPVSASLQACRTELLPPARAGAVAGAATAVLDVGGGLQVAASRTADRAQLAGVANGRVTWARSPGLEAAWWAMDPDAPAVADPADLIGFRVQLDTDAEPEVVAGWRVEENDLGMSRWLVAVTDFPERDRATVFEVANFGPGSFVSAGGGRCDLLATEWAIGHEPGQQSDGWNLLARRMMLREGAWSFDGSTGLLSRRLYESFVPAQVGVGALTAGDVRLDLVASATRVRNREPLAAARRVREERRAVGGSAARPAFSDGASVTSGWSPVAHGGEVPLRIGDAATGLLYPPAWSPAHPDRGFGGDSTLTSYLPSDYAELVSILWLRS